jgi:hypothetical protein
MPSLLPDISSHVRHQENVQDRALKMEKMPDGQGSGDSLCCFTRQIKY